jgi:hypothetical protein
MEFGVLAACCQEGVVRAALDDPPLVQHQDDVGAADRRQPVGGDDLVASRLRVAVGDILPDRRSSAIRTVAAAAMLSSMKRSGAAPVSHCHDTGDGAASSTESSTIFSGQGAARLMAVSTSIAPLTISSHIE